MDGRNLTINVIAILTVIVTGCATCPCNTHFQQHCVQPVKPCAVKKQTCCDAYPAAALEQSTPPATYALPRHTAPTPNSTYVTDIPSPQTVPGNSKRQTVTDVKPKKSADVGIVVPDESLPKNPLPGELLDSF